MDAWARDRLLDAAIEICAGDLQRPARGQLDRAHQFVHKALEVAISPGTRSMPAAPHRCGLPPGRITVTKATWPRKIFGIYYGSGQALSETDCLKQMRIP
jgi:hypothetical protein